MKDYHIYLFNNLENLNKTVGFINIKEKFINNSFIDEAYVLLSLSEDFSHQKEIPLSKIKKHLVTGSGLTVPQYSDKYSKEIKIINNYIDITQENLSWLDIFQIALLMDNNINETDKERQIKKIIQDLFAFKNILAKKY